MKRLIWGIKGRITQAAPGLAGGASPGKVAASDKGSRISPGTDPACPGNPTLLGCLCWVSRQGQGGICSSGAIPERLIPPGASTTILAAKTRGKKLIFLSFLFVHTHGCVVRAGQPSCEVSVCPKFPSQLRPPGTPGDAVGSSAPAHAVFWQCPSQKRAGPAPGGAFCDILPAARRPGITELAMLFSPRLLGDWFISMNNSIPALISCAIKA